MRLIKISTFADVHVHLREPGATQKEDFETGTKAAIAGGYTQILDMPNNEPPTVSREALNQKKSLARGRIWCDVGFNFGGSADSIKYFNDIKDEATALKVYMNQTTGSLLVDSKSEREEIFKNWASKQPIMVHAEGETIESAIMLAKKYSKKLHICHITYDQIQTIKKAKKEGINISCEVCPHHLFLSKDDEKKLRGFALMKPPLMTNKDRERMWEVIQEIDMISTDHAPHTITEKSKAEPKFGVPGLDTTLSLMLWAEKHRLISIKRITQMLSENPRKIFNLPNQPDTFMEIDLSKEYKVGSKKLYTKCGWTPFRDLDGVGEIKRLTLKGEVVYENGQFTGKPRGEIITPRS